MMVLDDNNLGSLDNIHLYDLNLNHYQCSRHNLPLKQLLKFKALGSGDRKEI